MGFVRSDDELVTTLRREARTLRQDASLYERSWRTQKTKNAKLEQKVVELEHELDRVQREKQTADAEIRDLETERQALKDELKLLRGQNQTLSENVQTYTRMLFSRHDRPGAVSAKKLGGQLGHRGVTRSVPAQIDRTERVSLDSCPDCGKPLPPGQHVKSHVVEDIPELSSLHTTVTDYEIEEQYCQQCRKHVRAIPAGVIPGSRLGLNLVLLLIVLRTTSDQSLAQLCRDVNILFGTTLSPGGVVRILHRARDYLGGHYEEILQTIQRAKVKHADETGWSQIQGDKQWDWVVATTTAIYHTIRNTRGKGIAQELLGGANCRTDSVVVRDDYAGYAALPCQHQRCWAHLLRVSRERLAMYPDSKEMARLHATLGALFGTLTRAVDQPFDERQRQRVYQTSWSQLTRIIQTTYTCPGAKKVQTRLRHEGKELLTALLHADVPLTNNLAERAIRPLVIFRKITGGSRSADGAKTTAVLRSMTQTIQARSQPLVATLKAALVQGMTAKLALVA